MNTLELTLLSGIVFSVTSFVIGLSKSGIPGLGLLLVPIMLIAFPAKESVGMLLPVLMVGDIVAIVSYRKFARKDLLLRVVPIAFVAIILGALLLSRLNNSGMTHLLGWLVLALCAVDLIKSRGWIKNPADNWWFKSIVAGLAGLASTLGNAAGPVMSIFFIMAKLSPQEQLGTAAWFFLFVNIIKLPFFISQGMLQLSWLPTIAWMIPPLLLGALCGKLIVSRIRREVFNAWVRALAIAGGVLLVIK